MFKKTTLKNGLRIITVPQKNAQTVTVLILIGTGSKYEKKEVNGISHFLEHMMFKGTKNRPTALEVAETMDRVGGAFNAFTGGDYTGYYAKVEASQFELAFDWVSDIFLNSALPGKEIEKEKRVIIEEINMYSDLPMRYVSSVLWPKLLYGDQPAGWDVAGTKKTVSDIDRKKIIDYREKQYVPQSTVICVAGKVKPGQVNRIVKKYFSAVKKGSPDLKSKVIENQNSPQCLLEYKKTDQTHLCLGVRAYNVFHRLKYAQDVLGIILGGMMSSRMFTEVREKLGLAYYIGTEVDSNSDVGYLMTQAGVDNGRVERAITTILKEYRKIAVKKVSASELKKAKDNLKGKISLMLEASDAKASFYGAQELIEGKSLTLAETLKKIDQVTAQDISKVAKDIFRPNNLNLSLIGPFKEKEVFNKLLNGIIK